MFSSGYGVLKSTVASRALMRKGLVPLRILTPGVTTPINAMLLLREWVHHQEVVVIKEKEVIVAEELAVPVAGQAVHESNVMKERG